MAYRMLANEEDACDATQDTFIRAFQSIHRFRADASVATWLCRIAMNVCFDRLRRRRRRGQPLRLVTEGDDDEEVVRDVPDEAADPALLAEQDERCELVAAKLAALSDEHRLVIVLYDLNGCSYDEMAEILGVPLGTVKSRLNRARLALRDSLEPHVELFARP